MDHLPVELLWLVLDYLELEDLAFFACLSRFYSRVLRDSAYWSRRFLNEFGRPTLTQYPRKEYLLYHFPQWSRHLLRQLQRSLESKSNQASRYLHLSVRYQLLDGYPGGVERVLGELEKIDLGEFWWLAHRFPSAYECLLGTRGKIFFYSPFSGYRFSLQSLQAASESGRVEVILPLLKVLFSGVEPTDPKIKRMVEILNSEEKSWLNLFIFNGALKGGQTSLLEYYLQSGQTVGSEHLLVLAKYGHRSTLQYLLKRGDFDRGRRTRRTQERGKYDLSFAINGAIIGGDQGLFVWLLSEMDDSSMISSGWLEIAIEYNRPEIVRWLLEQGQRLDPEDPPWNWWGLASTTLGRELLEMVLPQGLTPGITSFFLDSILSHYGCGDSILNDQIILEELFQWLLEHGIRIDVQDLQRAAKNKYLGFFRALISSPKVDDCFKTLAEQYYRVLVNPPGLTLAQLGLVKSSAKLN